MDLAKVERADLVQQTMLEALKERDKFAGRSDLEVLAYLRRALTHNRIDVARKFSRNRTGVSPDAFAASSVRIAG